MWITKAKLGCFYCSLIYYLTWNKDTEKILKSLRLINYVKYAFFGGNFILLIICFLKIWHHFVKIFHNVNLSLLLNFLISYFCWKIIFSCRICDIFKIVSFRLNYSRNPLKTQLPTENFDTSNVEQKISKIFPI